MDYERGLATLKQLAAGSDWYPDALLYEARLRENLDHERRYGSDEQSRSTRARIVDQLNQLAYSELGHSFNDLCQGITPLSSLATTSTRDQTLRDESRKTDTLFSSPSSVRTSAFISYSHNDKRYLEELHKHLAYYIRKDTINAWDDSKILPGAKWHEEIERALQAAKVAVLMVSADFLASDFIMKNELPPLLAASEKEGATILSVILRPCAFADSDLAQYQAVNSPTTPLSSMSRGKRDEVWARVAELVRGALKA